MKGTGISDAVVAEKKSINFTWWWQYRSDNPENREANVHLLRLRLLVKWCALDPLEFRKLWEIYRYQKVDLVLQGRFDKLRRTLTGEELLRRFKAGGEGLSKQPILLGGGLALLTNEERRELLALAPGLEYVGAAATRAFGRLLPKASCGVVELLVVACTMFDPEPKGKWEKMLADPFWRGILAGDANRATRRKMRRLVGIVRKMAKESYRKKSFEASDREVEFWVVAHKDHKGNLGKAWEAHKDERPFDSYASMLEAMHPLNLAFGITVHRGRPPEELGPELKDFPIEPDRIGAWYEKKGRGEKSG